MEPPTRQPSPRLLHGSSEESSTVIRKIKSQEKMLTITSTSTRSEISRVTHLQYENGSFTDGRKRSFVLTAEELGGLTADSSSEEVKKASESCLTRVKAEMTRLRGGVGAAAAMEEAARMVRAARAVPGHGRDLAEALCAEIRQEGGLELALSHAAGELALPSARLLGECMTDDNRKHVEKEGGLGELVEAAVGLAARGGTDHTRAGTALIGVLCKGSEDACTTVVRKGGLDTLLKECRNKDTETLRRCADGLANLSLFGGEDNQAAMVDRQAPLWLYHLAFQQDEAVRYWALIAVATLLADSEVGAAVEKTEVVRLMADLVRSIGPESVVALARFGGRCREWLERLVPVLTSGREVAAVVAAFHFCVEAELRSKEGGTYVFEETGALQALREVAGSPRGLSSRLASRALTILGEEVPHILSRKVLHWDCQDAAEWVTKAGFPSFSQEFLDSRVDGDLLLRLTEEQLTKDIGLTNGILVRRFMRELRKLQRMADYGSGEAGRLARFLAGVRPDLAAYAYGMATAGVTVDRLSTLTEEQLAVECAVGNGIHRKMILEAGRRADGDFPSASDLDVFVSYRRSNGSQLASLLKVLLELRGFSVFLDVDRLESGKFDYNLLHSIRGAKNFLLVLSPDALNRCKADADCKDWVHREIVAALKAKCNIIPITDHFQWPNAEELPEDMRALCSFNGVDWIHDYQEACLDKIERFILNRPSEHLALTPPVSPTEGAQSEPCGLALLEVQAKPQAAPGQPPEVLVDSPPGSPLPLSPASPHPPEGSQLLKRRSLLRKVKDYIK